MGGKCATCQVLLVLFGEVLVWAIISLGKRIPCASLAPDNCGSLSIGVFLVWICTAALLCVGQVGRSRAVLLSVELAMQGNGTNGSSCCL